MKNGFEYTLIRSNRRTIAIQITPRAEVVVRAPKRLPISAIERFIESKDDWIKTQLERISARCESEEPIKYLTPTELAGLQKIAKQVIPERVKHYAGIMGVNYGRISIRTQKTRWGSCSSKGNLNFNCLLMLAPIEVLDSVVVHELCHLKEMNHSKYFYEEVYRVFPDYKKWDRWLKDNGGRLLLQASKMPD